MAVLNYAVQYQQALQQVFTVELRFVEIYNTPNNSLIKWINSKTIQIPSISTGGFVDVDRDTVGSFTRRVDNDWTPYTLEHDREYRTLVDPVDVDETNMAITIANITQVFNTEQKIPEMDKYAVSKIYSDYVGYGGVVDSTALTTANILSIYDTFMEEMDEAEVPNDGRILYVTPKVNTLLKNAENIQRQLDVSGGDKGINRNVRSLDDVTIRVVPTTRMKSVYVFTDGAVADVSADTINMLLIHPKTVYAPQKYEFVSLDEPTAQSGGKYLYYERKYWDIFVVENKVPGIKFNTTVVV